MKKIIATRAQLNSNEAIWNAMLDVGITHMFPSENLLLDELSILVTYFNEMESGGHEAVLTWLKKPIQQLGFEKYVAVLSTTLEKIGAPSIAKMEKELAPQYWTLYQQLEAGEIEEEPFYKIIEQADKVYFELNEHFQTLVMNYFLSIREQIFAII